MNICLELHFPDDVLEKYALGMVSGQDCGPLEEHLLLCAHCRARLMTIEEFIQVIRAALTQLKAHPQARFSAESAFVL